MITLLDSQATNGKKLRNNKLDRKACGNVILQD